MQGMRELSDALPWEAMERTLSVLLALLMLYASADKILHPQDFAAIVRDYRILPDMLVNPVAVWLPWFELCLGVCLYTGWLRDGALVLCAGLLAAFWLAIVANYFRGIDVGCGCFSSQPGESGDMLFYMARDSFLLAGALLACEARHRSLAA